MSNEAITILILFGKLNSFNEVGPEVPRKCQTRLNSPTIVGKPKSFTGVGS